MIDLHCHMLPAIDDGAKDMETALAMARMAVEDGITHTACTPHIYPGVYENTADGIDQSIHAFRQALAEADLPLNLTIGADTHLVPEVEDGLRTGRIPTLNGGRYFLLEPPHHVAPPRFEESVFNLLAAGYVPVITHPERLSWIEDHYEAFVRAAHQGAWIQLTAGSVTGRFGPRPRYWCDRMLEEGIVHILATDAHNLKRRPPLLAEGKEGAAYWVGDEEADAMVNLRPQAILDNLSPGELPAPPGLQPGAELRIKKKKGFLQRLFG